jgi:hypothetical protein
MGGWWWVGGVKLKLKLNSAQLKLEFGLSLAKMPFIVATYVRRPCKISEPYSNHFWEKREKCPLKWPPTFLPTPYLPYRYTMSSNFVHFSQKN